MPGPGPGAQSRLVPWYVERPSTLAEEYVVIADGPVLDLNECVAFAGSFTGAVAKAQEWVAENDRPVLVIHQASVRVAVVGKEPPQ